MTSVLQVCQVLMESTVSKASRVRRVIPELMVHLVSPVWQEPQVQLVVMVEPVKAVTRVTKGQRDSKEPLALVDSRVSLVLTEFLASLARMELQATRVITA